MVPFNNYLLFYPSTGTSFGFGGRLGICHDVNMIETSPSGRKHSAEDAVQNELSSPETENYYETMRFCYSPSTSVIAS